MQQDITVNFPDALIDKIAQRVLEKLLPHLQPQSPDEILTVEEVAALLKTTPSRIYQKVFDETHQMGDGFPFHKEGRLLRFYRREILAWLDSNKA